MSDQKPPERFYHISTTQLSIARHYGGCRFNGVEYIYDPTTDTLIRGDVLQREQRAKREEEKAKRAESRRRWEGEPKLFNEDGEQ